MMPTGRTRWRDAAALAFLAAAVIGMFWPAVLMRDTFFVQDMMVQNYPFRYLCGLALRAGQWPLWRPEINCGFPLAAEGQVGVFYPLNLLAYRYLPTHVGLTLNILFHCWLAGAGTYWLLRLLAVRPGAALTGALTFCCGGFLVTRAMSPNFVDVCAWLPVLSGCVELALQQRRPVLLLVAGAAGALQLLAGHPQAAVYSFMAVSSFALWRCLSCGAGWRWMAAAVGGVPMMAALLAAVQLLLTAELVPLSVRGGGLDWERFVSMSWPPERLVSLILPNAFGNSADGTYWGGDAGFFIQLCAYAGVLPLLLAVFAVRRSRIAAAEYFMLLTGAGMLLSLGRHTVLFALLYRLPGLSFFRIPPRFLLWFCFGLSVLAGLGVEALMDTARPPRARRWWGLSGALLVAVGIFLWVNRGLLLGADSQLGGLFSIDLRGFREQLLSDAARAVLLLLAGGWLLTRRHPGGWIAMVVPLLVYIDLLSFGYGFNGLLDVDVLRRTPASARVIWGDAGRDRVPAPRILSMVSEQDAGLDWHNDWRRSPAAYAAYPATLRMYSAGLFGLSNTLPGWSPLHLRRHWAFVKGYMGFSELAGVEYVLRVDGAPRGPFKRLGSSWPAVYRHLHTLPRAYLVGGYRLLPEPGARLRFMMSPAFAPREEVVLEHDPGVAASSGKGEVRLSVYQAQHVEIDLQGCEGGWLVLSDTYYPGWVAHVDGRRARVWQANHVFRAVHVAPGTRQVCFDYQPLSLRLGAWISGLAWLGWGALVLILRRWRCQGRLETPRRLGLGPWAGWVAWVLILHALVSRWPLWAGSLQRCEALHVLGGG